MVDIQNIRLNKIEVKLADTDDPVASKTSWEPLKAGGSNFKSQKMSVYRDKIVVDKSAATIFFCLIFILAGIFVVMLYANLGFENLGVNNDVINNPLVLLVGLVFAGAGFFALISYKKMTFEKLSGSYYRGKNLKQFDRSTNKMNQGMLSDIHAIQLIRERISSDKSIYTSYEINLVLKNGERVNVMDHGSWSDIERSAKDLAGFLGVPIWQAQY